MKKTTAFYHDERTLWHVPGGLHALFLPVGGWVQPMAGSGMAESPDSKRRIKSLMDVSGLTDKLDVRSAPMATEAELRRVHPQSYLDKFKALSDAGGGDLGEVAPFGPGSFEIARLSTGLAIAALSSVLRGEHANAFSMSRPPGHHCLPDGSMGFCLLANIPLALEALRAEVGPVRVAVVDWDVHHGNGTEACFYDRDDTLTISLHQENCFPMDQGRAETRGTGRGLGFNLNIPLLPGGGHQSYMDAFDLLVTPALRGFKPDMIIVASGLDASAFDPLARMQANTRTYRAMAEQITALAADLCGGRLVAAHEGGYSEGYVPFCGLAVIETFAGHHTPVQDPFIDILSLQQPPADFIAFQRARLEGQARSLGYL